MAATGEDVLTMDNPVFATFCFYVAVLIAKTVLMSFWTARHRLANKALPSPEDYRNLGYKEVNKVGSCETVERVRRAHLNDLENIPTFILIGLVYLFTKPDPFIAITHFRVFTVARIFHTLGYLNLSTNIRGLGYGIGILAHLSLIGQVLFYTVTAGHY